MRFFSLLLVLSLLVISCAKDKNVFRYIVASEKGDCVGVAPRKCLLVKKGDAIEWTNFYSNIEGFEYKPGHEYVLDVKEEKLDPVPADASSIKFTLVKVVSKKEKRSENLPL